jgi:hypothetical protein
MIGGSSSYSNTQNNLIVYRTEESGNFYCATNKAEEGYSPQNVILLFLRISTRSKQQQRM